MHETESEMSKRRKPEWGVDPKVARARQKSQEMQALAKRGLELAPRPEDGEKSPPELPDDLSALSDKDLTAELATYTRWADFLEAELALAEAHERGCEQIVEVLEAQKLINNWGGTSGDRVNISRAQRDVDPEVRAAKDEHQVAYAKRKLIATIFHRAERSATAISRELTRRTEMEPSQRRTNRHSPW